MEKIDICNYKFIVAPDKLDRLYGVDLFRRIGNNYVGVQITSQTSQSSTVYGRLKGIVREQHREFRKKFGGRVFTVYNDSEGRIMNPEICKEIKKEISRLSKLRKRKRKR